jgi:hypothetical protein
MVNNENPVSQLKNEYKSLCKKLKLKKDEICSSFVGDIEKAEAENEKVENILISQPKTNIEAVISSLRKCKFLFKYFHLTNISLTSKNIIKLNSFLDTRISEIEEIKTTSINSESHEEIQRFIFALSSLSNSLTILEIHHQFELAMLSRNKIFWRQLCRLKYLRVISLKYCGLSSESTIGFGAMITRLNYLEEIDVEGNPIEALGAFYLLSDHIKIKKWIFRNCSIDTLTDCSMRCELFYKFTAEIKNQIQNNQKLELLDLSDNSMPEEELQEMLDYLKTRDYTKLTLLPNARISETVFSQFQKKTKKTKKKTKKRKTGK